MIKYEETGLEWKDVLEGLKVGKKYRRIEWEENDFSIQMLIDEIISPFPRVFKKIMEVDDIKKIAWNHSFKIKDFEANDWVEVE